MNKSIISALTLIFAINPALCLADPGNSNQGQSARYISFKQKKKTTNRPKAPSMQQIFCYYEDGELTFDFAVPEGDCALTVTDLTTNFARNFSFSSEAEATVYVGTLTEAYIEISTESGHDYEGYIE